jgi:alpha-galactosidase
VKRRLKIVLVGAASREFARGMVHDLVLEKQLLESRDVEVEMVDIDAAGLEVMHRYAERCASVAGAQVAFRATTDRAQALPGADFVLISVAVKRMELWEQDYRVPLAFGFPHVYGENGGPGAAFHALRNYRILMPICRDIERLCPEAWVLNFTNPEARVLTAILSLTRLRAVGLCHGFYSFRALASRVLARPQEELDLRTAGMNHFFTYYRVAEKATGRDLIPELEQKLRANPEVLEPLVRYLWQTFGALGYGSDHHVGEYVGFAHELTGNLWLFGTEGRKVDPAERGVDGRLVFEAWRHRVDVPTYLARDLGGRERDELSGKAPLSPEDIRRSGELAVPVIADIALDRGSWREAVNVLNTGGLIENLDADGCIEVPATVDARGVHPERVGRLPEGFAAMVRQQQAIQKLVVQAYDQRSRRLLLQALLLDPASNGSAARTEAMLDHMLRLQAAYLPELA